MRRRKFLIGAGSLAASGAAVTGTGAFSTLWTNRNVNSQLEVDSNAYLQLIPESPYANLNGNKLQLDFDRLNEDANTRFQNVFRIRNSGTQKVSIAASDDPTGVDVWDSSGLMLKWSDDAKPQTGSGLIEEDVMHDVDDVSDPGQTVVKDLPRLAPGKDIWVHPFFVLGPTTSNNHPADVPDKIGLYATVTQLGGVDQSDGNLE